MDLDSRGGDRPPPETKPEGDPSQLEVVVRAPPAKKASAETAIRTEEARHVAGTQGDALKVVQSLPGVARSAFDSGRLVVWGAAPNGTRVYVDGVEIPSLYHLGGLRSTVNASLVGAIALVPGAYGAEYGRGLGGIVKVTTRELPSEGIHGYVGADLLDASTMVTAALDERFRVGVAARYGYLDRILEGAVDSDIGEFYPIPRYHDIEAKATASLRDDETVGVTLLHSRDRLHRAVPSPDPLDMRSEDTELVMNRLLVRYDRFEESGASTSVTPFFGYDTSSVRAAFGATPTTLDLRTHRYGLRAGHRVAVSPLATFSVGVDASGSATGVQRAGSLSMPPREGNVVAFGQPPGDDVSVDRWNAHVLDVGPYAYVDVVLGPFTLTPGLRVDGWLFETSRMTPRVGRTPAIGLRRIEGTLEPRASIRYEATSRLAYTVSAGVYHQAPDPEDLSAVFGNPTLGLSSAMHLAGGQTLRVTRSLSVELVLFYEWLDDLVARSTLTTPPLARTLTQDGEGRSYGGQLLLRQELWHGFFGWVTYSLGRSEQGGADSADFRLFDYDQTHVLGVVASQTIGAWVLGARFRYASGMPRTPVVGAYYDARLDRYEPIFGAQNSIRLPPFYELDLRIERSLSLGPATLSLYLDVENVTYRKNPEEIAYAYDFSKPAYITGLPILASVGARVDL